MNNIRFSTPVIREWSDLFDDFFQPVQKSFHNSKFPKVNIQEKSSEYLLEMQAPGLEKTDFKINLDKDILTISYEKKTENEQKDEQGKLIRKEFEQSNFSRSFSLDDKIDSSSITANYENGVLKLTLPKKLNGKEEVRKIEIQ